MLRPMSWAARARARRRALPPVLLRPAHGRRRDGTWGEPAGITSLILEGVLIVLAIVSPAARRAATDNAAPRAPAPQP